MSLLKEKYGSNALIAGGSQGIGVAFAHALAAQGVNLFLIARHSEQLETVAKEIAGKYSVQVKTIVCDLSDEAALNQTINSIGEIEIDLLVYNAARPFIGRFESIEMEGQTEIAQVNVVSTLKFVHYFGSRMISRHRGAIILMSSLSGQQGSPFISNYAATKAFIRVLAEGLWYEWRKKGVDVMACVAGATSTPNFIKSNPKPLGLFEPQIQSPEAVVKACFNKLGKVPSFISGDGNRLAAFFMSKILPEKMAIKLMGDSIKKMYGIED